MRIATNKAGFRRTVTKPGWPVPPGACDSHMHIVGPVARFPFRETRHLSPPEATYADYAALASALSLDRYVVVQPSFYADDNSCTLDAIARSNGAARAVVVVREGATPDELRNLDRQGARGIRSQMIVAGGLSLEVIEALAGPMAELNWHLQLYVDQESLPDLETRLMRLPIPVVFDHMAEVKPNAPLDDKGFAVLHRMLESGRAWIKLSAAHHVPSGARARALAKINPERLLWGTDWPHVSYAGDPPDDGRLLDDLNLWLEDETLVRRVLVENPGRLYFGSP